MKNTKYKHEQNHELHVQIHLVFLPFCTPSPLPFYSEISKTTCNKNKYANIQGWRFQAICKQSKWKLEQSDTLLFVLPRGLQVPVREKKVFSPSSNIPGLLTWSTHILVSQMANMSK